MEGKLNLDKELTDCVIGELKTITLSVMPTANGPEGFEADVEEVVDYEEEGEEKKPEPAEPENPQMGKSMKPVAKAAKMAMYGSRRS